LPKAVEVALGRLARPQEANPVHLSSLLRFADEPRGEETAGNARNERAPGDHWINSSARASSRRRDRQTESLRGLHVDDELKSGGLLDL